MKNRERILIITDSVSMPRLEVKYEETWIYLFKNKFRDFDVIDRPARGSTSMRLVQEGGGGFDLLESYMPDRIIIQMGLAECAPRLFKKNGFEQKFINKYLPAKIRNDYIKAVKERRGRNPEFTDVPPEQFRNNIFNFAGRCRALNVKLAIIKILRPTDIFLKKSPFVKQNIDRSNSIFEEVAANFNNVELIDPINPELDINTLCLDELHVNSEGHKLYFKAVENYFKKVK
ncbi:MAG TPA: SGNH/GDSL hydrolase family protein [Spirochaetota bacterium]|nr:SGNH/GDSL hydrolase family protein [Spirochaetota bacterium]HPS85318.1 SGNH/GDSL hydrolase family protein [Spirochaetota bacterium]